jgi:hypothetical protein
MDCPSLQELSLPNCIDYQHLLAFLRSRSFHEIPVTLLKLRGNDSSLLPRSFIDTFPGGYTEINGGAESLVVLRIPMCSQE